MAALPYMQLYVADYLADTAYLDVIESGAYLHLLMNYWQTGKPLPNDDKKLARIAKCTDEQWLNVRSTVVEFFVEQENVLLHKRVEKDLAAIADKQIKASEAGKASAAARKKTKNTANVQRPSNACSTNVEETLNHTDTDTDTDTDSKKENTKRKNLTEKDLTKIYELPEQLASDFVQHRKSKKGAITKTVIDGFKREADKAGIALEDAIRISIEKNWQGFEAEWYFNLANARASPLKTKQRPVVARQPTQAFQKSKAAAIDAEYTRVPT